MPLVALNILLASTRKPLNTLRGIETSGMQWTRHVGVQSSLENPSTPSGVLKRLWRSNLARFFPNLENPSTPSGVLKQAQVVVHVDVGQGHDPRKPLNTLRGIETSLVAPQGQT